jgi:RNase P/RNase MRP subunit POP5
MGYSNYKKIRTLIKKFSLDLEMSYLFPDVQPTAPSAWLQESLAMTAFLPPTNEKAKSERIISPILAEVVRHYQQRVTLFSGEDLNINTQDDLSGECDFLFSLQKTKLYIDAPIISLAEAKDEDMEWGLAQCAAQMYGAMLFNEAENQPITCIYGCATDGIAWRFMKLENKLYTVDNKIYTDIPEVLGVWHAIIGLYL